MKIAAFFVVAGILAVCAACSRKESVRKKAVDNNAGHSTAVPVEISKQAGRYVLLRDGKPYEIKGAGIEFGDIKAFARHGGTSFRTWRTDNGEVGGQEVLDAAADYGLTVILCIEIGRERHGFDYDDSEAVARQLEYARGEVLKYRNHPALLGWMIGNEANLGFKNPRVFDAINEISTMIHEVDGKHPTTTALAGFDAELAALIETRAPDLDFVSIQMYGKIVNLPRYIDEIGFDNPFLVTEWGAIGHWEVGKTAWGAPIEQTSTEKARSYMRAHDIAIAPFRDQILGAYVFLWGQKQERTPTWYGMFLADGTKTETIDVMHYIWNGAWPDNRSPAVGHLQLDSKTADQSVVLQAGRQYPASIDASDSNGDALRYRWQIMRESTATQTGGDEEEIPETLEGLIASHEPGNVTVTAPAEPGAFRLFVYVYDNAGSAGHANLPFLVQ